MVDVLLYLAPFLLLLGVGGWLGETLLPKIKPLNDWIERLADEMED